MLTEPAHAFRGVLGTKVVILDAADPADFNAQLGDWLQLANQRHRRALGCAPAERIDADRPAMLELPPVAPATGWRQTLRLPRDH